MFNREKFLSSVTSRISKIATDKKKIQELAEYIYQNHKVPLGVSTDYLTMRKDIICAEPELAFAISEVLGDYGDYYTKDEITLYNNWNYEVEPLPKQLEFEMIEINEDQWIGRITAQELMKLRDAQVINYNENTQRVMRHIVKGKEEIYKISLNKKAVLSMEELFKSGMFISNTITFNMPESTNYNYKNGLLTIKNLDHFDITDGYHRYIALSNLYNMDNDFDYAMILQITSYTEDRSRQFIWQEDQKTMMSRIDSAYMNVGAVSNKVVQRLNTNSVTNLDGCINLNDGIINAAELSEVIKNTYFSSVKIASRKQRLLAVKKAEEEISQGLKAVTEEDPNLLDKRWTRHFLYCLIYNIYNKVEPTELLTETKRMNKIALEKKMFRVREISRIDMRRLSEMKKNV